MILHIAKSIPAAAIGHCWMKGCLAVLTMWAGTSFASAQEESAAESLAFRVEAINPQLKKLDEAANLETPQSCVENFVLSARRGEFARAARSLNFRLLDDIDEAAAADLARKFFYILNQELWIDWTMLPDRPDGLTPGSTVGGGNPMDGRPRRAIVLDTLRLQSREVPIYLQRLQVNEERPQWLFSAHAVENVPQLYEIYGPGWIERNVPDWAAVRGWGNVAAWQWLALIAWLVSSFFGGLAVTEMAARSLRKINVENAKQLSKRLYWPVAGAASGTFVFLSLRLGLSMPGPITTVLDPILVVMLVASWCWLTTKVVSLAIEHFGKTVVDTDDESALERQRMTQLTIARHVSTLLIGVIGISLILVELGAFRAFGVVLLTSAGAVAVIFGLAGQAVLGNAIAGLQIAFTQPFRIGDSVFVEGNWGRIEKITYTYVDIKTWDDRRLVMPIRHFITNPFENWSKNDLFLRKPIYLHVDYLANIEAIREEFLNAVKADEAWASDRDEPDCLVTEIGEEAVTVRLTAGAKDPSAAWSMCCRLREHMTTWLQEVEGGKFLPRRRLAGSLDPQE